MFEDRCPICNMDLKNFSETGKGKHISNCRKRKWKVFYTGNPVGRPPEHRPIRSPKKEDGSRRPCFHITATTSTVMLVLSLDQMYTQFVPDSAYGQ